MAEQFGPLVSSTWLRAHIQDPGLRVLDTRYYLDGRDAQQAFEAGHIPGATYVDVERDLTGRSGPGRHPLPTGSEFQESMRRIGLDDSHRVVAYDDTFPAARLRWLLRYYGHEQVALLDGGLRAWGGELKRGPSAPRAPGKFTSRRREDTAVAEYAEVRSAGPGILLLDARPADRYVGLVANHDPQAGHIPGARSAPWAETGLDATGRFLPRDEIRRRLTAIGVKEASEVIAYCGSGVQACHLLFAMELAGFEDGRLYVGSWSEWSRRPEAPIRTGPEP
jgi:thiosulfate/3-mercaptopyruvate sulfurtransferase